MSDLSRSDIQHLTRLARLDVSEEELERYAGQLTNIVHYVEQLSSVDTSKAGGTSQIKNVVAKDEPQPTDFDREAALKAFPRRDGNFLEVRAVLGGEVEAA